MSSTVARATVLVLLTGVFAATAGAIPVVDTVANAVSTAVPVSDDAGMRRVVASGEGTTVSATLQNPLDIPDVLEIRFSGEAIDRGNVAVVVPRGSSALSCTPDRYTCQVSLPAGNQEDVEIRLRGERPGRNAMTVSVVSQATGKAATADMFLIVTGETVVDAFWAAIDGLLGR